MPFLLLIFSYLFIVVLIGALRLTGEDGPVSDLVKALGTINEKTTL